MISHTTEFLEVFATGGLDFSCDFISAHFKELKGKTPSNYVAARIKRQGNCTRSEARQVISWFIYAETGDDFKQS